MPQNKIIKFIRRLNYAFAARMTLAAAIAWWLSLRFQLDKPYWSIMTVSIVAYPSQGALVAKFLARLLGTCIGALAVNIIANAALSDPWLFSTYLAIWITFCAYMASSNKDMVTYGFALCGYTAAIIGFSLALSPTSYMVFFITQARLTEITLGLFCAFVVSVITSGNYDEKIFRKSIKESKKAVINLAMKALNPEVDNLSVYNEYNSTFMKLLNFKNIITYDTLATTNANAHEVGCRDYNNMEAGIVNQAMAIHAMKMELKKNVANIDNYLAKVKAWFQKSIEEKRLIPNKPQVVDDAKNKEFIEHFFNKVETLCKFIIGLPEEKNGYYLDNRKNPFTPFYDWKEATINAIRTFVFLMLGVYIWLESGWTYGFVFTILIAVSCTLGATFANVRKLAILVYFLSCIVIPFAYFMLFVVLIKVNSLPMAMIVVLPIFFVGFLLKAVSKISFIFWHCFLISFIFLVNFDNPIIFDHGRFLNISAAVFASMALILIFFNIIRPTADDKKLIRFRNYIKDAFHAYNKTGKRKKFKIKAYNILHTASLSFDRWPNVSLHLYYFAYMAIMNMYYNLNIENVYDEKICGDNLEECLDKLSYVGEENKDIRLEMWELKSILKLIKETDKY